MDPILSILLSWQLVIFGLAIYAIVFVVRTLVEYKLPSTYEKFWEDVFLPIFPVVIGAVGAYFIKAFPYPDGLTTTVSRVIFGLGVGLLSTTLYRVIFALMGQKITAVAQTVTSTVSSITQQTIQPATQVVTQPVVQPVLSEQIPPDQLSKRGQL